MNNKKIEGDVVDRLKIFDTIDIDENIAKKAGEIRRNHGGSGVDALIAASAMISGAELATVNTKHFVGIKGLKLYSKKHT